eukprot:UN29551
MNNKENTPRQQNMPQYITHYNFFAKLKTRTDLNPTWNCHKININKTDMNSACMDITKSMNNYERLRDMKVRVEE